MSKAQIEDALRGAGLSFEFQPTSLADPICSVLVHDWSLEVLVHSNAAEISTQSYDADSLTRMVRWFRGLVDNEIPLRLADEGFNDSLMVSHDTSADDMRQVFGLE